MWSPVKTLPANIRHVKRKKSGRARAGNPYKRGRISTVDYFVLTSVAAFIAKPIFFFLTKLVILTRRSTVQRFPLQ